MREKELRVVEVGEGFEDEGFFFFLLFFVSSFKGGTAGGGGVGLHVVSVTLLFFPALTEAAPSDSEGSIDADKQEERPAGVHVEDPLGGNVRRYPSLAPVLSDKVEEIVGGGEDMALRARGGGRLGVRGDVGG